MIIKMAETNFFIWKIYGEIFRNRDTSVKGRSTV
jgi:hypothetical protein